VTKSAESGRKRALRLAVARLRRDKVRRIRAKAGIARDSLNEVWFQSTEICEIAYNRIMHYVYSLKCKDGFYIGCTDNIESRLERHKNGYVMATKDRLPVKLEFYFATNDKYKAFEFEKYLKSGSGRAFINKHLTRLP
jgi:putative endonuclease